MFIYYYCIRKPVHNILFQVIQSLIQKNQIYRQLKNYILISKVMLKKKSLIKSISFEQTRKKLVMKFEIMYKTQYFF